MPVNFESVIADCGDIVTSVESSSDAVIYDSASDTLKISTKDDSLGNTSVEVTINSHLASQPEIVGRTMTITVSLLAPPPIIVVNLLP